MPSRAVHTGVAKWLLSRVPLEPKSGNQPILMDLYVGDKGDIYIEKIYFQEILYILITSKLSSVEFNQSLQYISLQVIRKKNTYIL